MEKIITSLFKNVFYLFSLIFPIFTILCYTIAKLESNAKICFFIFFRTDFFFVVFRNHYKLLQKIFIYKTR